MRLGPPSRPPYMPLSRPITKWHASQISANEEAIRCLTYALSLLPHLPAQVDHEHLGQGRVGEAERPELPGLGQEVAAGRGAVGVQRRGVDLLVHADGEHLLLRLVDPSVSAASARTKPRKSCTRTSWCAAGVARMTPRSIW